MNQSNQQSSSGNPAAPEEMSNNDLIQAILVLQKNLAKQLLAAQEAAQAQAKLKAVQSQDRANIKAALDAWSKNVSPKTESNPAPQLAPGRIDLQQFKILDGPYFKGPFQEFEDYLWKSWEDFKEQMFEFTLPVKWKTALKRNIAQLKMTDTETFLEFSTRARTLQSLVNFDKHLLNDYELAKAVTFGLPEVLQAKIDNHQTLQSANFKYGEFENRTSGFYSNLIKSSALQLRRNASTTTTSSRMADTVWRLHSYLDSIGLCHFCKRHCGSAPKSCPNPMDKSRVEKLASFVPPPKPADYVPPVAWTAKNSGPAKMNPATAGRPIGHPAGVAGLANEAPDLDKLSASCLARVEGHLDNLAHGFANWHLTTVEDNTQAAGIAGDPKAIKMLSSLAATQDNKFVPEVPQFDEASFLEACSAIGGGGSAKPEGTITPTDPEGTITPR
ncbi:hypothetical protein PTTG_10162 [Puccinia triticina 1-1 BBBD Race 1]|uniref:Retrotransposon gag domain-containing protein n=1 Tax=Puccinia triticina (isolate 1-1 / race 1 (BBBD)) TaxID=630390 RepID=A0A0C4FAC1_PUCT1|nr:hypothetical protein PTTG_10162 [Puccinia triticina 1-1 BBBD Race 1]